MNGEEAYFLSRAYTDKNSIDPTNYYDKTTTDTLLSAKADASDTYTKTETDTLLADKVDWESNGVLGAKNLFPMTLSLLKSRNTAGTWSDNVYTYQDVSFTVNVDDNGESINSVDVVSAGTHTADAILLLTPTRYRGVIANGESYIITGCPSGGSVSTYCIKYRLGVASTGTLIDNYYDTGDGLELPVLGSDEDYNTHISIPAGSVISDAITFYPMLRLATDTDSTYQPYAMTNRELTEKVLTILDNLGI